MKSVKKILFISRPLSPPWDEASKNLAYFLARNISDFQIGIMTKDGWPEAKDNISQYRVYRSAEISDFNIFEKMRSLFFQWKMKGQFDINHYFFTPTRLNTFLIKNFLLPKRTRSIQTIATLREDLWSDDDLKNLIFANQIITYSDYSQKKLEKLGFSNVKRIYPGVDLEKYKYESKNLRTLDLLGIEQDSFIFTYPGEYARLGATDDVLAAFFETLKTVPNAKLVLACRIKNESDAEKKNEIIRQVETLGISDKVFFTDTFSDMPKIYNISDVILFPVQNMKGKFDVPLVIPEAFATEKAVIISDLQIFAEFAKEDNSVTIEKGNVEALAKAMVDLWKDEGKRMLLAKNGRRFAEDNFDIRKVASEYRKIYETL